MATGVQVAFDFADPDRLARFWAAALGYKLQDPPAGYGSWEDWTRERGIPEERWNEASAVRSVGFCAWPVSYPPAASTTRSVATPSRKPAARPHRVISHDRRRPTGSNSPMTYRIAPAARARQPT